MREKERRREERESSSILKYTSRDMEDVSWHIRYYEYSFLFYIAFSAAVISIYVAVYCVKMPVNKIPNLQEVIDNDPVINEHLYAIVEEMEEDERCHSKIGGGGNLNRNGKGSSGGGGGKTTDFCIVSQQDRIFHVKV